MSDTNKRKQRKKPIKNTQKRIKCHTPIFIKTIGENPEKLRRIKEAEAALEKLERELRKAQIQEFFAGPGLIIIYLILLFLLGKYF